MSNLQDTHTVVASLGPTPADEFDGRIWHMPTLTTWEVPEVTEKTYSGDTGA
jgi:hypothetical protein